MPDPTRNISKFTQIVDRYLDPASVRVILDVGSRDAEVALYMKAHYPGADVYAFECNPVAIELCKQNIGGRPGVHLVEKAVADVGGTLDFYAIEDVNIGASSLYAFNPEFPQDGLTQRKISVQAVTLQDWARDEGIDHIDIIWIDLQGAELLAFKGLREMLRSVSVIHTEVEYKEIYAGQPLANDVRRYLTSNGFVMLTRYYAFDELFGDQLYCHWRLLPWHVRILRSEPLQRAASVLRLAQLQRALGLAWTIWMLRFRKLGPALRRLISRIGSPS
jgi:FkbM family methyltransferase